MHKHPAEACLISQRYHGSSRTITFPAALYTDKGLLQLQSMSKTTGNILAPSEVLMFGPCSFTTNAEKCCSNHPDEAVPNNKGREGQLGIKYMSKRVSHMVFMLCPSMVSVRIIPYIL